MGRCVVPAAEEVLDKEFRVLDKGFVRLVDYMGSDARIVQAARVSYGGGTTTVRQDAGLIDYLLRNEHTSPFEQVVLTFHAKMPLFVARQWVRHRMARINEISGRYSVLAEEFYIPEPEDVAEQSTENKQGRKNRAMPAIKAKGIQASLCTAQEEAYGHYQDLLNQETARELARVVLPLGLYTEWYWQIDLHNLFRFIRLRLHPHAQREIRAYAEVVRELGSKVCPLAFESFNRHIFSGVRFSGEEMEELRRMLNGNPSELTGKDAERFEAKLKEGRQT